MLKSQAAPVPRPIRVNMFGLLFTNETHILSKNGHPAQRTTGAREEQLDPGPDGGADEPVERPLREHVRHGQQEDGDGEGEGDHEAAGHVPKLGVVLFGETPRLRLESHAAFRAGAWTRPTHLGMHGAGIDRSRRQPGSMPGRRSLARRLRGPCTGGGSRLQIPQGVRDKALATARAAEIIGAALVRVGRRHPLRVDPHAAHGVDLRGERLAAAGDDRLVVRVHGHHSEKRPTISSLFWSSPGASAIPASADSAPSVRQSTPS